MPETFGFIPIEGDKIFSVLHEPDERLEDSGVLMIHPFAEEKLWAGRVTTRLVRSLAEGGLPVFRFDFRGHGDSDLDHSEMLWETLLADAHAAAEYFRKTHAIKELHLCGIRFGGTLALNFASELGAASVGVVNPLFSGHAYIMQVLRSSLTTQLSIYGEVREDRQALFHKMRDTGRLNINGYHISATFFDEIAELGEEKPLSSWRGPSLILSLVNNERASVDEDSRKVFELIASGNPQARLESLVFPAIWKEQKHFNVGAPELFAPLRDYYLGAWRKEAV